MKKITSILTGVAILSLSLLFPLASCKKDDGLFHLKLSEVTHSVFYAPLYLADALGYFEEEKIDVEITNAGGADNVMAAVLSGDSDVGFCGPEAALYVLSGGSTDVPTVFGQLTKRDGSFLVGRSENPDFSWEDLKGKEVLAGRKGGVPAMTFEYVLKEKGVFEDVSLNYDVAFNLMTSAFEAGTADYCTMFEPVASEYQKAGKGYIVASVGESSGEIPYTCFMAKSTWLKKNESVAKGILRAVTKATKYVLSGHEEECARLLAPYFEGTSVDSVTTSLYSYVQTDAWVKNMAMEPSAFARLQDVIDSAGELQKRVEFSALVKTDWAGDVYKEIYG